MFHHRQMDMEASKAAEATQLLDSYYQIYSPDLPTKRIKAQWQADNKRGFFLGIIQEGEASHITRLHHLLDSNQFTPQQEFSTNLQRSDSKHTRTFIDEMFNYYILPFHKDYCDSSSCHTPLSSTPSSRRNSAEDLDYVQEERELTHRDLKKAVEKRDRACLFCWEWQHCQGAHIIAQKTIPLASDNSSLLLQAGLTNKHCVQNGILLCIRCHADFDQLKRYVDVVDEKLVVKVVNYSLLQNEDKHKNWERSVRDIKGARRIREEDWIDIDNRQAVEPNGEMALYFVLNDPTRLPNRNALKFHKTACLIWRMAGGAESEDESCSDDGNGGYVPVDYRQKGIDEWIGSSSTLVIENNS